MSSLAIGIDFGTTNSSLARATPDGEIVLLTENYRSILYLEKIARTIRCWSGPAAIEEYLEAESKGRLVQSLKSFLSSRTLKGTEVFGRLMTLEDLIARILRDLREKAEAQYGSKVETAVVGRPVRFVGSSSEDDDTFAEERLRGAFRLAGFDSVLFELEPVAAAHFYQSSLDHDELILIGDFGGGTSDFSLLRVGRGAAHGASRLLGNSGLGLAGDAFDARIVRHLVSPALGRGSLVRSFDKVLPAVPNWVYAKLEHWHHLSFLRTGAVINMLKTTLAEAFEPAKLEALIQVIEEDLGYYLHRAVQQIKRDLSTEFTAHFSFHGIEATVQRSEFESWIAEDLTKIEGCIDGLMSKAGADRKDIDMIFLTGGTSFVPAVRRIFESRFGADRIRTGNEFTSVARGLALMARGQTS